MKGIQGRVGRARDDGGVMLKEEMKTVGRQSRSPRRKCKRGTAMRLARCGRTDDVEPRVEIKGAGTKGASIQVLPDARAQG